jgi:hypothetical protein
VDSNQVDRNGKYSVGLWGNKVVELSRHHESTTGIGVLNDSPYFSSLKW